MRNRICDDIKNFKDPNIANTYFFTDIYDKSFAKTEVKFKSDQCLWIIKGIVKSSKKK